MRFSSILFLSLLGGCDLWPESQVIALDEPLWSTDTITLDDGVYAILPRAGRLVRVGTNDTWHTVSLDGARPLSIRADANHERLMAHVQWPVCDDPAPNIVLVEDCPEDSLYWEAEMAIIDEGKRVSVSSVPAHMNGILRSDGETVLLYMDNLRANVVTGPIIDLTEVMFLDMTRASPSTERGLHATEGSLHLDGTRAVVMSRSHVVVIDLVSRRRARVPAHARCGH